MSLFALSDSFEYLCYGSTATINIFTLTVRDRLQASESDVYRRQILTTKVGPLTVRVRAASYIPENTLNFSTTKGFRRKISIKLVYQCMAIFFNFSPTSNHLHPLQVENCDSNSRLVVDEYDNG